MAALGPNNTVDTLNGNFKKVYMKGNDIVRLIPQSVKIFSEIEFIPTEKMGGSSYSVPVQLQAEQGFSYGGSAGNAFALNDAVAGEVNQASVKGCELVLRSNLSIAAASRAEKSEGAFVRSTKLLVQNMQESMHKRLEMQAIYGQVGIGVLASVDIPNNKVVIADSDWASGIWTGARGMKLSFYSPGNVLRGSAQITSVDIANKTLNLDLAPATVAAADIIYDFGAFGKEFAGIHKILSNSGTLFDIDASIYELWKSTSFPVAGNLSFPKIQQGIAAAVGMGLDEDMDLYVSPVTWEKLATDQAALRKYDYSYKSEKSQLGSKVLEMFSQNGAIKIHPHTMVKQGYAYGLVLSDFEKVGSSDVTFQVPGRGNEEFFKLLESANGYELRLYCDLAIICHKPNKQLLFTGITNA